MSRPEGARHGRRAFLEAKDSLSENPLLFEARREPDIISSGDVRAQWAFLVTFAALGKSYSHASPNGAKRF